METTHIDKIFEIFYALNPAPRTELEYKNTFTLLVAVILSAQSTDVGVNKATKNLFEKYQTPEEFLSLGIDGLKTYIKTIGLYNNKAENIIKLCNILVKNCNSKVPDNMEGLLQLPGVGRKTANVVLNAAFGKMAMPVDTHVHRVAGRIGLSNASNPDKVEKELMNLIPERWLYDAHHWLVLHGRYICKARKPSCNICPISNYCKYYKELNDKNYSH
ncbi:MAG: endonuclease III [Rickettsiaceae bacterium]|nr:endonuclease III [Rickettsiaceae bacterium]